MSVRRVFALAVIVGCKHEPSLLDQPTPPTPPAAAPAPASSELAGTVAETMDSGGYTYARLDRGGNSVWIAGPETKLAVGTKLGRMDGTMMQGFRSDTLKRTFDEIYFVTTFATGTTPTANATGTTTATGPTAPAASEPELSGVVLETMNAGGYTYAHLDHAGTKLWVAGPTTAIAVGSQLGKMTGTLMQNFRSDTLKRTFEEIYFVNTYTVSVAAIPNPHTGSAATPTAPEPIEKIAPAPDGTTVADVITHKDTLVGKAVTVRGKVVKLNNGILGRNWLHLRDGTGTTGTNDLLITTDATAQVGDVVVARGTVATHQDFGSGYKYDVIVEKAALASK